MLRIRQMQVIVFFNRSLIFQQNSIQEFSISTSYPYDILLHAIFPFCRPHPELLS